MPEGLKSYSDERLGIAFSYPAEWPIDKSDRLAVELSPGPGGVAVVESQMKGPTSLESEISEFVRDILPQFPNSREISRARVNGSAPGIIINFEWTLTDGRSLRSSAMIRVKGTRVYTVTTHALKDLVAEFQPGFNQVTSSFRLSLDTPSELLDTGAEIDVILDSIDRRMMQIRGLSAPTGMTRGFQTRDDFVVEAESLVLGEESRRELELLKEFCLVLRLCDESDDLFEIQLELLGLGVLGYYTLEGKALTVVTDRQKPDPLAWLTYSHEYVHALQDEHFGLAALEPEEDTFDSSIAVLALEEGDAELSKNLFYDSLPPDQQALLAGLLSRASDEFSNSPIIDRLPAIIRDTYGWEYTAGTLFVFRIYLEGGIEGVTKAYENPPKSTEQVIYPEKYLEGDDPHAVALPDLASALAGTWEQRDTGVMGQLLTHIYLAGSVESQLAALASQGWGGDRYVLLKDAQDRALMAMLFSWDTENDAAEFFQTYLELVDSGGHGPLELVETSDDLRLWVGDSISLCLSFVDGDTLVVIGPDRATVEAAAAEISTSSVAR